jgi:hypothetical protein
LEELLGLAVFVGRLTPNNLAKVGCELSLLIPARCDIGLRRYDFTPRLQTARWLTLDGGDCRLLTGGPRLLFKANS